MKMPILLQLAIAIYPPTIALWLFSMHHEIIIALAFVSWVLFVGWLLNR